MPETIQRVASLAKCVTAHIARRAVKDIVQTTDAGRVRLAAQGDHAGKGCFEGLVATVVGTADSLVDRRRPEGGDLDCMTAAVVSMMAAAGPVHMMDTGTGHRRVHPWQVHCRCRNLLHRSER